MSLIYQLELIVIVDLSVDEDEPLFMPPHVISVHLPSYRRHLATTSYWTWLRMGLNCCSMPQTRDLRCFFSQSVKVFFNSFASLMLFIHWLLSIYCLTGHWSVRPEQSQVEILVSTRLLTVDSALATADWCLNFKSKKKRCCLLKANGRLFALRRSNRRVSSSVTWSLCFEEVCV